MANVAGVTVGNLLFQLSAGQNSLFCIDDDNMVAAVHMGSKGDLLLAAKKNGGLCSNAAKRLARCVENIPFARNFACFWHGGIHSISLQ